MTYETWASQHGHEPVASALALHASSFRHFYFEDVGFISNGDHFAGCFRPLWPERCHLVADFNSTMCRACAYLCGEYPSRAYLEELGLKTYYRSTLIRQYNSDTSENINQDSQKPNDRDAQSPSMPKRGRHARFVNKTELAKEEVRKEVWEEAKAKHMAMLKKLHDEILLAASRMASEFEADREAMLVKNRELLAKNVELSKNVAALEKAAKAESGREMYDRAVSIMEADGGLTETQAAWAKDWKKRACSPAVKLTELQKDITLLAMFEMKRQSYDTFKVFLSLPDYDYAKGLRKKHPDYVEYSVGNVPQAWQLATRRYEKQCTLISSDGTRWVRFIDLLRKSGFVGRAYPPDIRDWPVGPDAVPDSYEDLEKYVGLCRGNPTLLSHELVTVALHAVTGMRYIPSP